VADENKRGFPEIAKELWEMTVAYAKQETVEPIKGLGKYLAFGLAGSACIGLGCVLLVLAGLRALQTEVGSFQTADPGDVNNLTWIPYLIMIAIGAVIIGLVARTLTKKG
jgi:hypothetical protein